MQIEKDYTNELPKVQVYKLCESWDIYIQKCVVFGWKICYFYFPNILLASDVVCTWLLIGQSQSVIDKKIGVPVDDDWQVVVSSSLSPWIHSVIGQLLVLSLVLALDITISIEVWKCQPTTLNQNILVTFDFF